MNYTKLIQEIEADHQRQREEMDNIQYNEALAEIGIEIIKS